MVERHGVLRIGKTGLRHFVAASAFTAIIGQMLLKKRAAGKSVPFSPGKKHLMLRVGGKKQDHIGLFGEFGCQVLHILQRLVRKYMLDEAVPLSIE